MIAHTHADIQADGVLGRLTCEPPLTVRRLRSEDPHVCALGLIGTAAAPLSGDHLTLELQLQLQARATLRATGASVAQGRAIGTPAELTLRAGLGDGAALDADPGPLIVSEGSRVNVHVEIALGAGATVRWRELIVLGRTHDERPGAATIRWDVTRQGRPVLRQYLDLVDPARLSWGGTVGGHRVMATELISDPRVTGRTVVLAPTAVAQALGDGSVLATVLADDAADALLLLSELSQLASTGH